MSGTRATGLAAALIAALAAAPAHAGNTVHPRTPVLWPASPCIVTIDRSATPTFEFAYAIPTEDTMLSFDEFEDSRRHQFIGFCRQWPAGRPPPRYVSVADLQRSVDAGLEEPTVLDDPEATLETSADWAGCWTRITPDDARRPITHDAAAEPVVWDLASIDAGTWLLAGYTWEPPYSLWSRAPWVLRVLDEPQPAELQAAATIADTDDVVGHDGTLELPICVDAVPGSTLTLEWAPSKAESLTWTALDPLALDGPSELVVPLMPPPESWGLTIVLRAVVDQPLGAAYEAHGLAPVIVFAEPEPEPETGDGDGDGDGDTGGTDTGDAGTETGNAALDDGSGPHHGRCSLAPARGNLGALAGLLALFALPAIRRRRDPTVPRTPRSSS